MFRLAAIIAHFASRPALTPTPCPGWVMAHNSEIPSTASRAKGGGTNSTTSRVSKRTSRCTATRRKRDSGPENQPVAYLHVNSLAIRRNAVRLRDGNNTLEPVLSCRSSRSARAIYAEKIGVTDSNGNVVAWLLYEPEGGMACGAKVFLACAYQPRLDQVRQQPEGQCVEGSST